MPYRMTQARRVPFRTTGCSGSEYFEGYDLAQELWGAAASASGSSHHAFAYLWRRFGPPASGCDDHKDLVGYTLTTPDRQVFLRMGLGGSRLDYSVAMRIDVALEGELYAPHRKWEAALQHWFIAENEELVERDIEAAREKFASFRFGWNKPEFADDWQRALAAAGQPPPHVDREHPIAQRIEVAIRRALKELLRPVRVRDVPINVLGVVNEGNPGHGRPVEPSRYAGYGVPLDAMDRNIRRWKREEALERRAA